MNIFYVHRDPTIAATMLADQHVIKMIVETAQLLSTAIWENGDKGPLKPTHKNHPSAIWARQSKENYKWLFNHMVSLLEEYENRYDRRHKYDDPDFVNKIFLGCNLIVGKGFTEPPQCMPDKYKVEGDAVQAYRNYYICEKSKFAKWKHNNAPDWYTQAMNDVGV